MLAESRHNLRNRRRFCIVKKVFQKATGLILALLVGFPLCCCLPVAKAEAKVPPAEHACCADHSDSEQPEKTPPVDHPCSCEVKAPESSLVKAEVLPAPVWLLLNGFLRPDLFGGEVIPLTPGEDSAETAGVFTDRSPPPGGTLVLLYRSLRL